ncbi:MAG TPA: hypothetical protein VNE41_03510 [Chitinophagaceae bacterium]|nr:hypothetical protein [Chitinophagaceae bacterium]
MNKLTAISFLTMAMMLPVTLMAQASGKGPQMAGLMHRNGQIFVVVAVLVVIFAGIILFLVGMERKVSRLEKAQQKNP